MVPTPFGPQRVFDAHTHLFPRSFYTGLAKQAGISATDPASEVARRLGWELPSNDPAELARRWLAEMDRHGVDRMVAIHTLPGDLDSAGRTVRAAGGRLVGYVSVDPGAEGAAADVERAVTEFGFRGVALFPALFGFSITSEDAYEVLGVANWHALNVFVHCGVLKVGFRTKLGLPCPFDLTLANPLLLQRPAVDFPKARFIVPHLGSGFFRELLMLADACPNVYADTSGLPGWAKYLDGAPSATTVLRQAVAVMGVDRLLFGTDSTFFPRGWRRDVFDEQLRVFQEAGLGGEEIGKLLGGNLERLLATEA